MNLSDFANIARSISDISNNLGKLNGAKGAYLSPPHFNVLSVDFENMLNEDKHTRQWACAGHKPHITHRFAQFGKGKDQFTLSTTFDCLAE